MTTVSKMGTLILALLLTSGCGGRREDGKEPATTGALVFPTVTRETLLSANPEKWIHLALVRESSGDGDESRYRWEYIEGDRDRRGPGAFVRTIECFLNAQPGSVEVVEESERRLEITFAFNGRDQESTLHVVAEGNNDAATVSFDGEGELYDEFMERIHALEDEYVDVTPETPDDSLNWAYRARLPGGVQN